MKNSLVVAEDSFNKYDIIYTLLLSNFEINKSGLVSLEYKGGVGGGDVPMKTMGLQIHLSQVLSAAPRRRSLVTATALPAVGITRPEVWGLWRNNNPMSLSERHSRLTQWQ